MRKLLPILALVLVVAGGILAWYDQRETEPDPAGTYPQGTVLWVLRPQSAVYSQADPHGKSSGAFNFEAVLINRGPIRVRNVRVYLKSGAFNWTRLTALERAETRTKLDPGQGEELTVTVVSRGKTEDQIRAEIGGSLALRIIWSEGGRLVERTFQITYPTGQGLELKK